MVKVIVLFFDVVEMGKLVLIVILDIDEFKVVNDVFGYVVGD